MLGAEGGGRNLGTKVLSALRLHPNPWLSAYPDLPGSHQTRSCGNFRHTYCFLLETPSLRRCWVYLVSPG